jgi:hypothetical protein
MILQERSAPGGPGVHPGITGSVLSAPQIFHSGLYFGECCACRKQSIALTLPDVPFEMNKTTFFFMRLPVALSLLGPGLVRFPKRQAFSEWMTGAMASSFFPGQYE